MSEVATRTSLQEVVAQVRSDEFRQQIESALPGNVTPDRFVRVTVTALRENPDVLDADRGSLFSSVVKCAQDGLFPDGREAALVVFKGKVQYLPMISGFRKIAAEHGWSIRTEVVHANDVFEYELGLEPKLIHRPARLNEQQGDPVGAYAVGTHKDGRKQVEVLTAEEIAKVRAVSRASKGPWFDWTERMWEKTAGRRLFAKLPLGERDPELIARVLEASRPLEPGEAQTILYGPPQTIEQAAIARGTPGSTAPADSQAGQAHDGPVGQQAEETEPSTDGNGHEQTVSSAPDFDGEEPTAPTAPPREVDVPEPTFGSGRYAGKTIVEIYSEGKDGISYLKWALRNWKSDPMKTALAAFAEHHEEVR